MKATLCNRNFYFFKIVIICILQFIVITGKASKFIQVSVVDKDYILIHFSDGQVVFHENTQSPFAYTSNRSSEINTVEKFGTELNLTEVIKTANWTITSQNDPNYKNKLLQPLACYRKSKPNGMAEFEWNKELRDFNYENTMEHFIFLKLPYSMVDGKNYKIQLNSNLNSDIKDLQLTFDVYTSISEAVHVNLVGYDSGNQIHSADIHIWMGNGGARDYTSFAGKKVYLVNTETNHISEAGKLTFWKKSAKESGNYNFTASDVWKADFQFADNNTPGTYRIAIEDIGCSNNFEIKPGIYLEPFRVSVLGFYYMRIGEDSTHIRPIPRRPLYIPGKSPENTKVIITDMNPSHPEWRKFTHGDVWDQPNDWAKYIKPGTPENIHAYGGHSDALDWDRHLGHVSIIYDMLLPYILTDGKLNADNLGITESGNGIPDLIDEARNEVDFWLRLRFGKGYSHGLTNPDRNNVFYQADNTSIAAWANAVNCSILAYCFKLNQIMVLEKVYRDSAIAAYNYAKELPDPMYKQRLSTGTGNITGTDLRITAAAYLYNITGDTTFENYLYKTYGNASDTALICGTPTNRIWAVAAYLKTKQKVHYPQLFENLKKAVVHEALLKETKFSEIRPSRRATEAESGYFKTIQNVQRTILAHAICSDIELKRKFLDALTIEADWGLGRNSDNRIYMTTASTPLGTKRSIENAYTSGRNDGTPGLHPGHTPYLNTDDWNPKMIMGSPSWLTSKCFPDFSQWPVEESYFNTRYVWSHSEFTPQQTMRGKTALYGYLYGLTLL